MVARSANVVVADAEVEAEVAAVRVARAAAARVARAALLEAMAEDAVVTAVDGNLPTTSLSDDSVVYHKIIISGKTSNE